MPSPVAKLLADVSEALDRLGLRWYVFGAQAVLFYGRPRLTEDVDVTVFLGAKTQQELCAELATAGFELDPVADNAFILSTRVLPFTHDESGMALDVILGGPGLEELFVAKATLRNLAGVDVPVIRAEHLLVTKILAGRNKDLSDARGILNGPHDEIDLEQVGHLLADLDEALGRSDLVPLFESLKNEDD